MIIKEIEINELLFYMIENDWVGRGIITSNDWEPHITNFMKRNLCKDSIFVDVGSNYGWHSITLSKYCKEVYSFEPQTVIHNLQFSSITKNGITNIKLFNSGVGDKNKKTQMNRIDYSSDVNIGDLSVGVGGETVEIVKLDDVIHNGFDFIKIDVQGYEKFVIEGSYELIKKFKPTIIIEMEDHQLRKFGYGCETLFDIMKDLGYVVYLLDYHYPSDHVCVHKDNIINFISKNYRHIQPLTESNSLNSNKEFGVKEKIIY